MYICEKQNSMHLESYTIKSQYVYYLNLWSQSRIF